MNALPEGYKIERKKIDGIWYILIYAPDGTLICQVVDSNQSD